MSELVVYKVNKNLKTKNTHKTYKKMEIANLETRLATFVGPGDVKFQEG